ncbi:hypothetical protein ABTM86_20330, partial [Acinetobacter baumannii]
QKAFGLCGIGALIAPTPTHRTGVGPSFSHSRVAAMYRLFAQHHAVRNTWLKRPGSGPACAAF